MWNKGLVRNLEQRFVESAFLNALLDFGLQRPPEPHLDEAKGSTLAFLRDIEEMQQKDTPTKQMWEKLRNSYEAIALAVEAGVDARLEMSLDIRLASSKFNILREPMGELTSLSLLPDKAISSISDYLRRCGVRLLIDPFSMNGFVTFLFSLHGFMTHATDISPVSVSRRWQSVRQHDALEIDPWLDPYVRPSTLCLVLSLVPFDLKSAEKVLLNFRGDYMLWIGEMGASCGNESLRKLRDTEWDVVSMFGIPTYPSYSDLIILYKRKGGWELDERKQRIVDAMADNPALFAKEVLGMCVIAVCARSVFAAIYLDFFLVFAGDVAVSVAPAVVEVKRKKKNRRQRRKNRNKSQTTQTPVPIASEIPKV